MPIFNIKTSIIALSILKPPQKPTTEADPFSHNHQCTFNQTQSYSIKIGPNKNNQCKNLIKKIRNQTKKIKIFLLNMIKWDKKNVIRKWKGERNKEKNENFDFFFLWMWEIDERMTLFNMTCLFGYVLLCFRAPLLSRQLVATNRVFCLSVNRLPLFAVLIPCTFAYCNVVRLVVITVWLWWIYGPGLCSFVLQFFFLQ